MDVEYFGPNPQMTGWYLGALRAAEEMARALGDDAFATLGWSLGVGLELRSKGSSTGVRLDGSVLGGLDPNTDVLRLLGLHFIVGGR